MASLIVKQSPGDSPLRQGLTYTLEEVAALLQLDITLIAKLHVAGHPLECAGFVLVPVDSISIAAVATASAVPASAPEKVVQA